MLRWFLLSFTVFLSGCDLGYLIKNGYHQIGLLNQKVELNQALKSDKLSPEQKRKLELAKAARDFAIEDLKMKGRGNYDSFVQLKGRYVTWVVSASEQWSLKTYRWKFPIVGEVPYKGYFTEEEAKIENQKMIELGYDTYLRGVSAYSTLGWFKDPLLSSMLEYSDVDLVSTIIHELTHAHLFIKSAADFNERFATFVGLKGAKLFYQKTEGPESPSAKLIDWEHADDQMFSEFISLEIRQLESWYTLNSSRNEEVRKKRIQEINDRFKSEILPKMKSKSYQKFGEISLNNARLGVYKTYVQDLKNFEIFYQDCGENLVEFLKRFEKFKNSKDPEKELQEAVARITAPK